MAKKTKRTAKAAQSVRHGKDNRFSTKIQQVRRLFQSGGRYTAVELNDIIISSDARKIISDLRSRGWLINDTTLEDGHKIYWLEEDKRQMKIPFDTTQPNTPLKIGPIIEERIKQIRKEANDGE